MTAKQHSDLEFMLGQLEGISYVLLAGNDETSKKVGEAIVKVKGNIGLVIDEMWEVEHGGTD